MGIKKQVIGKIKESFYVIRDSNGELKRVYCKRCGPVMQGDGALNDSVLDSIGKEEDDNAAADQ